MADIIIITVLAIAAFMVLRSLVRKKGKGCCAGGCSGCSGCNAAANRQQEK